MPRYREEFDEEDRCRKPEVPGAFGIDNQKERQERFKRRDRHFLDGTGPYANQLRILVEEEYGFRDWLWTFPGTVEEVVAEWKAGRIPTQVPNYRLRGELDRVLWDTGVDGNAFPALILVETNEIFSCIYRSEHNVRRSSSLPELPHYHGHRNVTGIVGYAHVHEHDDSWIRIGYYELNGLRNPRETIHVLDALAHIK